MGLRTLAIIPARAGSKGVPGKNIRPLGGRPLICWSIAAAGAAVALTRTVVSTDGEDIAEVARGCGAEVPFLRPDALATDRARAIDVIQHGLRKVEELAGERFDAVLMLQPTTPFRTAADIAGALRLLAESGADSVISVCDVGGHHPARMKFLKGDRLIDPDFVEAYENQPRQELAPMFIRNGAIYLTRRDVLLGGSFKGQDCRAWVMPAERSVNIDTELDFRFAELLAGSAAGAAMTG